MEIYKKHKSQLLSNIESSEYGDVISIESYFELCASAIEICVALDMAVALGIKVESKKEPWLNSDNWREIMKIYLTIHKEFVTDNTLLDSENYELESDRNEYSETTCDITEYKILLINNILEINPNAKIEEVCNVVGISVDTYNRKTKLKI